MNGSAEFTGDPRPPKAMLWQPVVRDNVPVAVLAFYWMDPTFAWRCARR